MASFPTSPLVYIDDDEDDQFLFQTAISELKLGCPIRSFTDGAQALAYLVSTMERPLMILSDMNMPLMDGLELHRMIDENALLKSQRIPFVYFTTEASPDQLQRAHQSGIQGFHIKAQNYDALKEQLRMIVNYWQISIRHKYSLNSIL